MASTTCQIDIIEPNVDSLKWGLQIAGVDKNPLLKIQDISLSEVKPEYTVVIIATSSKPRAKIVEDLSKLTSAKGWILEKVLACSVEELDRIGTALDGQNAWVNTPRRITSIYREMRDIMNESSPVISFVVKIPNLALACNSIHFVDAVEWLSGSKVSGIRINTEGGWFDSKRAGYKEFDGSLVASFENGSELLIDNSDSNVQEISISSSSNSYSLIESEGIYANNSLVVSGRVEFQSELSARLVESIANSESEGFLPSLEDSIHQHRRFFEALDLNPILSEKNNGYWDIS
jgi:hypothetical protein